MIDIPEATLDVAILTLARQAHAEIASTEPGLARVRSRAIRGRLPVRLALEQLLAGTAFEAQIAAGGAIVIRRRLPDRPLVVRRPAAPMNTQSEAHEPVIVIASKRIVQLLRYPGTIDITSMRENDPVPSPTAGGAKDLADFAASLPMIESTHLGTGREKLFIRGVADSSFNGGTQSPTSIYWDDTQLNYTGPDPGLRLYDVRSVDVLEGPQGTLYGSGAIGGVIRVNSNPVDLSVPRGSLSTGLTITQSGAPGAEGSGMINLPLARDRLGVRSVFYESSDGGYLDDHRREAQDINRTTTVGGRLTIQYRPNRDWQLEVGSLMQSIESRDGQYAQSGLAGLARASAIPQPYRNRIALGRLSIARNWPSGLQLFSSTAIVQYRSHDQFDASAVFDNAPSTYLADRHKRLLSHESRLTRSLPDGSNWVVGVTLFDNRDMLARAFETSQNSLTVTGVTNVTRAASAFVESTSALSRRLLATLGARVTISRVDGEPTTIAHPTSFIHGQQKVRVDPTLALSWEPAAGVAVFTRLQTGFRTGGLEVAPGRGRVRDFQSDSIQMAEIGFRKLRSGDTGLALSSSLSLTRWDKIQADLITQRGMPSTVNLGTARIAAWEGKIEWVPDPSFAASVSYLISRDRVEGPIADRSLSRNRRLPDTPLFAGHADLRYRWLRTGGAPSVEVAADYVGRSVLGTGDLFDLAQGQYLVIGASAGIDLKTVHLSLSLENLGNVRANRFAFGNPFELAARNQTTPFRPRNLRFALSTSW